MRVLHIIDSLSAGGSQRALSYIVRNGKARGIEYHICCLQAADELSAELAAFAPITHLGYSKFDPRAGWGVLCLIKEWQPDVVQTMLLKANLIGGFLAVFTHMPVILAQRSGTHFTSFRPFFPFAWMARLYVRLFDYLAKYADYLVTFTQNDRLYYCQHGVLPSKVVIILNGIDLKQWTLSDQEKQAERAQFRGEIGVNEDAQIITQLARLSPEKDPLTLLHSFRQVAAQAPDVHLCLVGKGPLEQELRTFIERNGLTQRVHLLGYRADVANVLAGTDIMVLSSASEPYPNVILEGWALHLPVISTACSGPSDMITSGQNGLLVPIRDHEKLVDGLLQLIGSEELCHQLGEAGYKRLLERHTLDRMQENFEDLYRHFESSGVAQDRKGDF